MARSKKGTELQWRIAIASDRSIVFLILTVCRLMSVILSLLFCCSYSLDRPRTTPRPQTATPPSQPLPSPSTAPPSNAPHSNRTSPRPTTTRTTPPPRTTSPTTAATKKAPRKGRRTRATITSMRTSPITITTRRMRTSPMSRAIRGMRMRREVGRIWRRRNPRARSASINSVTQKRYIKNYAPKLNTPSTGSSAGPATKTTATTISANSANRYIPARVTLTTTTNGLGATSAIAGYVFYYFVEPHRVLEEVP